MTNISCTNECVYQKEGKCDFSSVTASAVSDRQDCPYARDKGSEGGASNKRDR